eukprot:TRINITY_DN74616_c0_g1_i1.p2 TRINITY_DN74616_c0_g1~~TRINITY_DN74616_c0_g1_i1.p2  ORF type:complete len:111 (-),score=28.97 TRINITY_DN74616_c0_g1_i1:47-379(-)
MPLATVYTDVPALLERKQDLATIVHDAIKSKLHKPDMYITVNVVRSEYLTVNRQPASVVVHLDSIGGELNAFCAEVCKGLAPLGVDSSKVVMTFRNTDGKEFAMNGRTIF